jgi:hypothetical protein
MARAFSLHPFSGTREDLFELHDERVFSTFDLNSTTVSVGKLRGPWTIIGSLKLPIGPARSAPKL